MLKLKLNGDKAVTRIFSGVSRWAWAPYARRSRGLGRGCPPPQI